MRVARAPSILLAFALFAQTAAAEQPNPRDRAVKLVVEGAKKFDNGDKHGAIANFEEAYRIYPAPEILYNLGKAYKRINEVARAYKLFRQFLAEGKTVAANRRSEAEEALRTLAPYVGKLDIRVPEKPGALLTVNGAKVGTSPVKQTIVVKPGVYVIRVFVGGKEYARVQVAVSGGKQELIVITRSKVPSPEQAAELTNAGNIAYTAPPPAPVYKRWWFWTALIAVAGTTAVVLVTQGDNGSSQTDLGHFPFNEF